MSSALTITIHSKQTGSAYNVASSGDYIIARTMEYHVHGLYGVEAPFKVTIRIYKTQENRTHSSLVYDIDEVICVQDLVV